MPKAVEDILRRDGLSLRTLERLSYASALGINLKKNLHYFNKELLFDELKKINGMIHTKNFTMWQQITE